MDIRERLSRQEPDRADFLRDLSVSYERMGDLLRGLGQGEQARAYFQKDLEPQGMQHCYILSPGVCTWWSLILKVFATDIIFGRDAWILPNRRTCRRPARHQ